MSFPSSNQLGISKRTNPDPENLDLDYDDFEMKYKLLEQRKAEILLLAQQKKLEESNK